MQTEPASLADEKTTILIVDDDASLRQLIRDFLTGHGYAVVEAGGGKEMREILDAQPVDALVLDVMMPGEDGLSIARSLSTRRDLSIVMVSALGSETDRIIGLEVGADDYLPKPFSPRELLARLRAVLRRQQAAADDEAVRSRYIFQGWTLDVVRQVLRDPANVVIGLSQGEFSLLRALVERPQRVLTRDQLLEYARGRESDAFDRAIDTQISRLRRKLGSRDQAELIRTVRNEGYMFLPKVSRK
ncbi:response regulator [Sphingosinicella sp. CPCC 101087]|uniref:response regulator n=1 Tax=Sphingosinicella sp. CPCC 101087 TaxID=2497754 RepID=UPI00101DE3C9|nr:response regulator [Sphingosinicella sp. CPCC 101087]